MKRAGEAGHIWNPSDQIILRRNTYNNRELETIYVVAYDELHTFISEEIPAEDTPYCSRAVREYKTIKAAVNGHETIRKYWCEHSVEDALKRFPPLPGL